MEIKIVEYLKGKGFNPRKRGSVYQMLCPFHIDKNASFTIYEQTNSFFCFGCNTGGSLKYLMKLFGDPIPAELIDTAKDLSIKELSKKRTKKEKCISIINIARHIRPWYKNQLCLNRRVYFAVKNLES
jgi:DNA primase